MARFISIIICRSGLRQISDKVAKKKIYLEVKQYDCRRSYSQSCAAFTVRFSAIFLPPPKSGFFTVCHCFRSGQDMEFAELIKTPKVDGVILHRPFMPIVEGTLCLTGHHLILSSRQDNTEELWLLHSNIDSIDKR